jgi:hypothetical protein
MFVNQVAELSFTDIINATKSPLHPTLCRGLLIYGYGAEMRQ